MSEEKQQKKMPLPVKLVFIFGYGSVFLFYAVVGAVLLSLVFPNFSFILFMVLSCFVGMKLDYKFKGPASKFEQRYVSRMEK